MIRTSTSYMRTTWSPQAAASRPVPGWLHTRFTGAPTWQRGTLAAGQGSRVTSGYRERREAFWSTAILANLPAHHLTARLPRHSTAAQASTHLDLSLERALAEVPHPDKAVLACAGHQPVGAVCRKGQWGGAEASWNGHDTFFSMAPRQTQLLCQTLRASHVHCSTNPGCRLGSPAHTPRTGPSWAVTPGLSSSSLGAGTPGALRLVASAITCTRAATYKSGAGVSRAVVP